MLKVVNHTPFVATVSAFPDQQGVETLYAVVKAVFRFTPQGPMPHLPALPLIPMDVYVGEPAASSLRVAGEIGLLKPATDVLLSGRAIAPREGTRVADVGLMVGPVRRLLRVFGDRHWEKGIGGWHISEPRPWSRMPIQWELAFGGIAPAEGDGPPAHEARNPVGKGFIAPGREPAKGQPLPNLEDPQALIQRPEDRPTPACLAPVAPTWLPRRAYAGTYDEAWQQQRAPYLPLDFDARYFNVAPPELVAPGFLQGGESVRLMGFTAGDPLSFDLPHCGLELIFNVNGVEQAAVPQLETVLFEPDSGRFQMLWRCALPVDKQLLKVRSITVLSQHWGPDGRPLPPMAGLGAWPAGYAAQET